ncbi:hypothetical protein BDZ45DRAFT_287171 [Acephala macrosclerotiorum]|nr:hypothetical protein BDZ45DRAFT_287171 [Acephala macrosclerotiorum]
MTGQFPKDDKPQDFPHQNPFRHHFLNTQDPFAPRFDLTKLFETARRAAIRLDWRRAWKILPTAGSSRKLKVSTFVLLDETLDEVAGYIRSFKSGSIPIHFVLSTVYSIGSFAKYALASVVLLPDFVFPVFWTGVFVFFDLPLPVALFFASAMIFFQPLSFFSFLGGG